MRRLEFPWRTVMPPCRRLSECFEVTWLTALIEHGTLSIDRPPCPRWSKLSPTLSRAERPERAALAALRLVTLNALSFSYKANLPAVRADHRRVWFRIYFASSTAHAVILCRTSDATLRT